MSDPLRTRATEILSRLKNAYPVPGPFTRWRNVLELVIVTVLSAQCTDERVNRISPALFRKYRTAKDFASADTAELEKLVYTTGYYRSKARYLRGIGEILRDKFKGKVSGRFEDLIALPGVSKKSACVILSKGFGINHGVAVDTHVLRVAPRLGLSKGVSGDAVSRDLEKLYPASEFAHVNEYLITHGRAVCKPRTPLCGICVLASLCPTAKKFI